MKGWGKSPPRAWQQGRHGKPRLEQDQIGTSRGLARGVHRLRCPGRSREPISNGRSRGMIVAVLKSGTKPGLQAVWHTFLLGLSAFGLLEACSEGWNGRYGCPYPLRLGPPSDYPRISAFWRRSRVLAGVNLLSGNGRLEQLTACEYFACSVYVPAVRACLSRHTSKHG